MPELPDVERFRRLAATHLVGSTIEAVDVVDASVLRNTDARRLERLLVGREVAGVERRGKWLVIRVGEESVVVHFGMTGSLALAGRGDVRRPSDRVVIVCGGEEVRYRDVRKLGGLWVARDDAELADIIGVQGPDASAISFAELTAAVAGRRGAIKPLLMDQRVVAGLGNMSSDEILWAAGIDPARRASTLSAADVRQLRDSMREVTRRAVEAGRIPRTRSWLSSQRGEPDPVCPRCQGPIERRTIAGRTSLWCPDCQH